MASQFYWILLIYFLFICIAQNASKELRVVCYYTNWSVYRPGTAKFSPQNINPYLCTHLVYAFGGFTKENTLKPFDKYQDIEKGGYAKFTGLKTYNKQLKTMLAIGGWNEGSSRFSPMVASPERRKELVKNVVKFLRQNHFDGLDLDWEYPSFRDGGKARDRDNYAQLVKELREEFERETEKTGRPRLLLTMAVPAGIEYINKGYDVPKLMKYLDWMNILSYDYHSAFEPSVNHHAPLYPLEEENEYNYDTDLNIDHTIKHYLEAGAISDKLVLGIPTYGRSYTLFNEDANEIGAPADGPGEMGDATRENGYLAYYEICEGVKNEEWTVVQPNEDAMGPYAFKDDQWVGYDDEAIARRKAQYVADKNLGGIMFWAIDNDDFRGTCHNKPYPIIEAAKEALVEALGLTEENAISKSSKPIKNRGRQRGKVVKAIDTSTSNDKNKNSGGKQSGQSSTRRRIVNRVQTTEKPETTRATKRKRPTRKPSTQDDPIVKESGSSLVVTPGYITPEPPTTPDPGGDFKCEDEGFFPHPRECKKYFWCLNGPSELGIIAHQFTCPAGLYFNKAAASCDYTQNVLCNKKVAKATTTTYKPDASSAPTTEATTKKTELFNFSTRRPLPKITAATSRTTLQSTTSTTAPEYEEYEYDDGVEDDNNENDSEDPKVIKELLELIKKAGGIEELEKQLHFNNKNEPSETTKGTTTTSSISKKLYERVLAKTKLGEAANKQNKYTTFNRNSRGPQNEGLKPEVETKSRNSRLKYSTISRQRASKLENDSNNKEDNEDEDEAEEEDEEQANGEKEVEEKTIENNNNQQYTILKRSRPTTTSTTISYEKKSGRSTTSRSPYVTLKRSRPTTEANKEEKEDKADELLDRKVLGEGSDFEYEESSSPKYISLQRNRPSTSTQSSTSRYTELRRSTTPLSEDKEVDEITESPILEISSTASTTSETNSLINITNITNTLTNINEDTLIVGSTVASIIESEPVTITTQKHEIKPPQLLEPRPFSFNTNVRSTTKTPTTTTTEKITTATKKTRRPTSRFRVDYRRGTTRSPTAAFSSTPAANRTRTTRRRFLTPTTTSATSTTGSGVASIRPSRGQSRFRLVTRKHYLSTTAKPRTTTLEDQSLESSNQNSKEETMKGVKETTELSELAHALQKIQQAPIRNTLNFINSTEDTVIVTTPRFIETTYRNKFPHFQRSSKSYESATRNNHNGLEDVTKLPVINRTKLPAPTIPSFPVLTTPRIIYRKHRPVEAFEKIAPSITAYTYKPISEYDYYDDGVSKIVGSIPEHSKVLIHSSGVIQCLDQGNFPHPVSCKKFISCAKMETGNVLGWEYTCPKNLSFDPVGGMCNWSAGLGCNE